MIVGLKSLYPVWKEVSLWILLELCGIWTCCGEGLQQSGGTNCIEHHDLLHQAATFVHYII
jgi:hypothetical protein